MKKYYVVLIFAASVVCAQTKPAPKAAAKPAPATQDKTQAHPAETPAPAPAAPVEIPMDAPVITLKGFCPKAPVGTDPTSADCKTVVTRGEFEKLLYTLAPNAPPNAKQQFAGEYVRSLVLSAQGDKMGLDKSDHFNEVMKFMRMRALAQEFVTAVQEQSKPTAADVQKYYQDNQSKYEEMSLKRVFIPRSHPASTDKAAPAPKDATDAELQADGAKVLTQLKGGATFDKVQKDVYEAAGFKTPPPPTSIPNWRFDAVPPAQQALFTLKKGEYSSVIVEAAGAYIYQVEDRKVIPLDQLKTEIESRLGTENLQKTMEKMTGSIQPEINQAYLQTGPPTDREVHALTPLADQPATPKTSSTPTPKK